MKTPNEIFDELKEADTKRDQGCYRRLVRVRESSSGDSLCYFHGWTQVVRCAVGDGSAIFTPTEAIIERIHNGEVFYAEPHKLTFCDPNAQADSSAVAD